MTEDKKTRKIVKCPGRFSELREYFYNEVMPIVLEDRRRINFQDLNDLWHLIMDDIYNFDHAKDPYFFTKRDDSLRKAPTLDCFSLVPLVADPIHFDESIIRDYAVSRGNNRDVADVLERMGGKPSRFLESLGKDANDVVVPAKGRKEGVRLTEYVVNGNFGVGTISGGGTKGGGVRSDSPYLLEIYRHPAKGEPNLVALVGFWAQDNSMIISQMQPCRKAKFPEGVQFGVGCLRVAEIAARAIGFDQIKSYSARKHPIFREHTRNWGQFGKEFVCQWDNSAKKLGFEGSRNTVYEKNLKDNGHYDEKGSNTKKHGKKKKK